MTVIYLWNLVRNILLFLRSLLSKTRNGSQLVRMDQTRIYREGEQPIIAVKWVFVFSSITALGGKHLELDSMFTSFHSMLLISLQQAT